MQSHNQAQAADALASAGTDFAEIKTAHPDIANPPVYPLALAGLMKVLPFNYPPNLESGFWSDNGNFWRYEPDFLIASFNEATFAGGGGVDVLPGAKTVRYQRGLAFGIFSARL